MAPETVFKSSNLEKEYQRDRRLRQRFRFGTLFEQVIFAAFMAAVVLFGVYLLFDTGGEVVVKDRNPAAGENRSAGSEGGGSTGSEGASGSTAGGGASGGEKDSQYYADSSRWSTHIGSSGSGSAQDRAEDAESTSPSTPQTDGGDHETSQTQPAAGETAGETSSAPETQPPARQDQQDQTATQAQPAQRAQGGQTSTTPPEQAPSVSDNAGDGQQAESQPQTAAAAESGGQEKQASPAPAPAPRQSASASAEVLRAQFSYGMASGEPTGSVTYIDYSATDHGLLYFFTEVSDPDGGRITHQWRHNGEVVKQQTFSVHGSRVATSSSYEIDPDATGTWRVYVLNGSGEVIKIGSALYQ